MLTATINGRYTLKMPRHLAEWDAHANWERARFLDMERHLMGRDVLFDVGSEHGQISAVYASFVGGGNMCLIEPSAEFWPGIRAIWEANGISPPRRTWAGFVGAWDHGDPLPNDGPWPACSNGDVLDRGMPYRYLHEPSHVQVVPAARLDSLVFGWDVAPTAITVDVEGAELEVMKGAGATLAEHRPMVWLSVHPDLLLRDYGADVGELWAFMGDLDYHRDELGYDHELHVRFTPKERL